MATAKSLTNVGLAYLGAAGAAIHRAIELLRSPDVDTGGGLVFVNVRLARRLTRGT